VKKEFLKSNKAFTQIVDFDEVSITSKRSKEPSSKFTTGFTLIELLVVIAIIGILSSVVIASLGSARDKGNDTKRKADLHQIQNALELYYSECGTFLVAPSCNGTPYGGDWSGIFGGWFNVNYGTGAVSQGLITLGLVGGEIKEPSNVANKRYMISLNKDHYTIWATLSSPSSQDLSTLNKCYFSNWDNYAGASYQNYCLSN